MVSAATASKSKGDVGVVAAGGAGVGPRLRLLLIGGGEVEADVAETGATRWPRL
jgi:hypothetical protein